MWYFSSYEEKSMHICVSNGAFNRNHYWIRVDTGIIDRNHYWIRVSINNNQLLLLLAIASNVITMITEFFFLFRVGEGGVK